MEEEAQNRQAFKQQLSVVLSENSNNNVTHVVNDEKTASSAEYHRLWPEVSDSQIIFFQYCSHHMGCILLLF